MSKPLYCHSGFMFGSDPELFLSMEVGKTKKRKMIVGSEVVVPAEGHWEVYMGKGIVRDGVQVELHNTATTCRANQSNEMSNIFRALQELVDAKNKELGTSIKIDLEPVVKLTKGNLQMLSADSRQLGCLPSLNAYGRKHIQKDGTRYLIRAAGGHIHFGSSFFQGNKIDPAIFAKVCDLLIGIPCVLIDRHPLAALRRKVYGRAGEYRTPKHGFEYRTLSNFWLWNYKLFSLVMGLAATTFYTGQQKDALEYLTTYNRRYGYPTGTDRYMEDPIGWLFERTDFTKVEKAINTNDFEMALDVFNNVVAPYFQTIGPMMKGLTAANLDHFRDFFTKIREAELAGNPNPLTVWFPQDPVKHWINKGDGHGQGWESYVSQWRLNMVTKSLTGVVQIPTAQKDEPVVMPQPNQAGVYIAEDAPVVPAFAYIQS